MQTYTITGAADWTMLVTLVGFLGGGFGAVLLAMIGMMWRDLGGKFDAIKADNGSDHEKLRKELEDYKIEHKEEHAQLKQDMKDCQSDCCPPRVKK